jgi:predicted ester cyclase
MESGTAAPLRRQQPAEFEFRNSPMTRCSADGRTRMRRFALREGIAGRAGRTLDPDERGSIGLTSVMRAQEAMAVSLEENKNLIRRYVEATDANQTSDWAVLDDYIAEDFVAHNPLHPGVSLDREGMKQGAELFRIAAPGSRHEIRLQVAEDDLVVSHIVGRGVHAGELLGIPPTHKEIETEGIVIHRVRDGKIVEYWSVTDVAAVLQQVGVMPGGPS